MEDMDEIIHRIRLLPPTFLLLILSINLCFSQRSLLAEQLYTTPSKTVTVEMQSPVVCHHMADGQNWQSLEITVPGKLHQAKDKELRIVVRFLNENRELLKSHDGEITCSDKSGNVSGSKSIIVPSGEMDLKTVKIEVPYYALNLPFTGYKTHWLSAYAEVFVDNESVGTTPSRLFRVNW